MILVIKFITMHYFFRISGLDPAGPYFYDQRFNITPISKNVAFFVDIIHTDAGVLGTSVSTGTVDFWPNGGKPVQPGCLLKRKSCRQAIWIVNINVSICCSII